MWLANLFKPKTTREKVMLRSTVSQEPRTTLKFKYGQETFNEKCEQDKKSSEARIKLISDSTELSIEDMVTHIKHLLEESNKKTGLHHFHIFVERPHLEQILEILEGIK